MVNISYQTAAPIKLIQRWQFNCEGRLIVCGGDKQIKYSTNENTHALQYKYHSQKYIRWNS